MEAAVECATAFSAGKNKANVAQIELSAKCKFKTFRQDADLVCERICAAFGDRRAQMELDRNGGGYNNRRRFSFFG